MRGFAVPSWFVWWCGCAGFGQRYLAGVVDKLAGGCGCAGTNWFPHTRQSSQVVNTQVRKSCGLRFKPRRRADIFYQGFPHSEFLQLFFSTFHQESLRHSSLVVNTQVCKSCGLRFKPQRGDFFGAQGSGNVIWLVNKLAYVLHFLSFSGETKFWPEKFSQKTCSVKKKFFCAEKIFLACKWVKSGSVQNVLGFRFQNVLGCVRMYLIVALNLAP